MIIGPRYKIARRLGVGVFEKTQTAKFAARSMNQNKKSGKPRAKSDYGLGLLEKQKARYSYGITAKQFGNYVKAAISKKGNSGEILIGLLESRLDNVVLRAGFAPTRQAARQMVSHGHITVGGQTVTIPSFSVKVGDIIGIKETSKKKPLFASIDEKLKVAKVPAWLKLNLDSKEAKIDGAPRAAQTELFFNVGTVLEFFSR